MLRKRKSANPSSGFTLSPLDVTIIIKFFHFVKGELKIRNKRIRNKNINTRHTTEFTQFCHTLFIKDTVFPQILQWVILRKNLFPRAESRLERFVTAILFVYEDFFPTIQPLLQENPN